MAFLLVSDRRQGFLETVLVWFRRQRERRASQTVAAELSPQLRDDIGLSECGDLIETEGVVSSGAPSRRRRRARSTGR